MPVQNVGFGGFRPGIDRYGAVTASTWFLELKNIIPRRLNSIAEVVGISGMIAKPKKVENPSKSIKIPSDPGSESSRRPDQDFDQNLEISKISILV